MSGCLLELKNVSKVYPEIKALHNVSLQVQPNTIHGLLGPNGAGKSTMMNIMAGLIPVSEGEVLFAGKRPSRIEEHARYVGLLPEKVPLYENMKVWDYLTYVAQIHGVLGKDLGQRVQEVVDSCGLKEFQKRIIANLSKGMKQRVGLAQALIPQAPLLILDEPFVGLDPHSIMEMRQVIMNLSQNHTILFSSHQLYEVQHLCSMITILNRGEVIQTASLEDLSLFGKKKFFFELGLNSCSLDLIDEVQKHFGLKMTRTHTTESGEYYRCEHEFEDLRSQCSRFLIQKGANLIYLNRPERNLEEIFNELTSDDAHSGGILC